MQGEHVHSLPTPVRQPYHIGRWILIVAAAILIWIASGWLLPPSLLTLQGPVQGMVTIFLGIFIEALPFLMAGVLASSAIHLFVSDERVQRLSPRSPILAALTGGLLGLAFPVCECGSVPTTRRLLSKGAPLPLGIAFILAAPVINPVVIVSTSVAFSNRPEIVIGRIVLTLIIAVVLGIVLGANERASEILAFNVKSKDDHTHDHDHAHDHFHDHDHSKDTPLGKLRALFQHASSEFFEMVIYLIIGAMIASAMQIFIPRDMLLQLGQGPILSAVVLMGLAVVLSICSTVDSFVALAFSNIFPTGSILAFLVFGPMIDIKSILMFTTTFRRKTIAWMIALTFMMTLLAANLINRFW